MKSNEPLNNQAQRREGTTWFWGSHEFVDCASNTVVILPPRFWFPCLPFQTLRQQHLTSSAWVSVDPCRGHWSTQSRSPLRPDMPLPPSAGSIGCFTLSVESLLRTWPWLKIAFSSKFMSLSHRQPMCNDRWCRTTLKGHSSSRLLGLADALLWLHHSSFSLCPVSIYLTSPQVLITGIVPAHQ